MSGTGNAASTATTSTDVAMGEGVVQSADEAGKTQNADGSFAPTPPAADPTASAAPLDADAYRWKRIHANDFENLPFFMIVTYLANASAMGYALVEESTAIYNAILAFVVLYTIARFAHTASAITSIQPFRTIFWMCGTVFTLVCMRVCTSAATLLLCFVLVFCFILTQMLLCVRS